MAILAAVMTWAVAGRIASSPSGRAASAVANAEQLTEFINQYRPRECLAAACLKAGDRRPAQLSKVKEALFGAGSSDEALDYMLAAAAAEPPGSALKPTFRAHMFIRRIQGVWACSKPDCDQVLPEFAHENRRIGKLYASPVAKCGCGGQVLELLYCYDCGEAYLGGFVTSAPEGLPDDGGHFLESGPTDLTTHDPGMVNERQYGQYMWYWPGTPLSEKWSHQNPSTN